MGMDQYIYAKASNGQELVMYQWRKNYALDTWLRDCVANELTGDEESWSCELWTGRLELMEAAVARYEAWFSGDQRKETLPAVDIEGVLTDAGHGDFKRFLWAARRALEAGFTLTYGCSV